MVVVVVDYHYYEVIEIVTYFVVVVVVANLAPTTSLWYAMISGLLLYWFLFSYFCFSRMFAIIHCLNYEIPVYQVSSRALDKRLTSARRALVKLLFCICDALQWQDVGDWSGAETDTLQDDTLYYDNDDDDYTTTTTTTTTMSSLCQGHQADTIQDAIYRLPAIPCGSYRWYDCVGFVWQHQWHRGRMWTSFRLASRWRKRNALYLLVLCKRAPVCATKYCMRRKTCSAVVSQLCFGSVIAQDATGGFSCNFDLAASIFWLET